MLIEKIEHRRNRKKRLSDPRKSKAELLLRRVMIIELSTSIHSH